MTPSHFGEGYCPYDGSKQDRQSYGGRAHILDSADKQIVLGRDPISELLDGRVQQFDDEQKKQHTNKRQAFPSILREDEGGRERNSQHQKFLTDCLFGPRGGAESAAAVYERTKEPVHGGQ
jgi:hypothetical protein